MRLKQISPLIYSVTFLLLSIGSAKATPVTGTANIAGNVSISRNSINFISTFTNTTGAAETGSFSGLLGGTILSLSGGPDTGKTYVQDFAVFNVGLAAPVYFDLTYISPGVGTASNCNSSALGASCTPPGSPFTLIQLPNNTVIAALQLSGNLYVGASATGVAPANSVFSTQTSLNGTIPSIIAMLSSGQTLSGITYSAAISATNPVPEPTSTLLVGVGFIALGLLARRRKGLLIGFPRPDP